MPLLTAECVAQPFMTSTPSLTHLRRHGFFVCGLIVTGYGYQSLCKSRVVRNNYAMVQPIPLPLNDVNMLGIIRELASNSENVFIEPHAKKRMKLRNIT